MKKILLVLIAILSLGCSVGLIACGDSGKDTKGHIHDYGTEWVSTDPTYHWHECQNDGCPRKEKDKEEHSDTNGDGKCDVCDHEYPVDDLYEFEEITEDDRVVAYSLTGIKNKDMTSVVIPSSYKDLPVSSIGSMAFYNCGSLMYATIPDSIKYFDFDPFGGCDSLQYNEYDNGLYLGNEDNRYYALIRLKDPFSETCTIHENTKIIAGCAFGESAITNIVIPNKVISIGTSAFINCGQLTDVIMGNSVTVIGSGVFSFCGSLEHINIPNSVTEIGWDIFWRCYSLTSVTIPKNVSKISGYMFNGCVSLESINVADGNTTYHSAGNCLIETASKTLIGGCKNSVIPNDGSVTSIDICAFRDHFELETITIPSSVVNIGAYAFESCSNLTEIIFLGATAQWNAIAKGDDWDRGIANYTVHCSDGDIEKA